MTVLEAVQAELDAIRVEHRSGLAASALVLAAQLDDPTTSPTAVGLCSRALRETLDRLWDVGRELTDGDDLSLLAERRKARRANLGASDLR